MLLDVHPTARISDKADIEQSTRGTRIVIGAYSVIDSFVKIKPAGGSGDLLIGERVTVNSGCVIYTGNGLVIGNDVAIAANCVLQIVCWLLSTMSFRIKTAPSETKDFSRHAAA